MATNGCPGSRRVRLVLTVAIAVLGMMAAGCGDDTWEDAITTEASGGPALEPPTTERTSTTASTTTTSTTTTTIPSGTVAGRVYLLDRDEPVETTVELVREEEHEPVATTRTDAEGYYWFSVEEAGSYEVQVSVIDLLDVCDELRTQGEMSARWPIVSRTYSGSGVSDVQAVSVPESVSIGDEVIFDLDLYCDPE